MSTLATNIQHHPPLSLHQESSVIKNCLSNSIVSRPATSQLRLSYNCLPCSPPTLLSTLTTLPDLSILHYSGHGTDSFLTIENDDGSTIPVDGAHLSSLLSKRRSMGPGQTNLKIVFISACQSQKIAQSFVDYGIPHVIAVDSNTAVLDSTARVFAEVFYQTLLSGMSVQTAFDLAKDRLVLEDKSSASHTHVEENSSAQFLLLGTGDHEGEVVFPLSENKAPPNRGGLIDLSPPILPSIIPPPNSATVANRSTIHTVYSRIIHSLTTHDAPRLITLVGPSGIGKSQIALFALRYLRERDSRFNLGGMFSADLQAHIGLSGGRRRHRSHETFNDIVSKAFNGSDPKTMRSPAILFLDGCDVWMCSTTFRFNQAVSTLIQTCPNLIILATARNGLCEKIVSTNQPSPILQRVSSRHFCQEKTITIPRLSNYHAAQLLCARSTREFDKREMYGGLYFGDDGGGEDVLSALGESSIVKALHGHPELIEEIGGALGDLNLVADEARILQQVVPKAKSKVRCMAVWRSACGSVGVGYGKMADVGYWIARDFDEVRKGRHSGGTPRRLSVKCFEMLTKRFVMTGKHAGYIEEAIFFSALWTWWNGCVSAVNRCGVLWDRMLGGAAGETGGEGGDAEIDRMRRMSMGSGNPGGVAEDVESFYLQSQPEEYCVHGFVEREEAATLLNRSPAGTFLIRFASQVGCLAITYVKTPCYVDSGGGGRNITLDNVLKGENRYDAEIASVLVKPSRRSVLGWEIEGVYYDGLGSLICAIEELKWLYPHHAKGATFSYTGGRREGGIGGALQGR